MSRVLSLAMPVLLALAGCAHDSYGPEADATVVAPQAWSTTIGETGPAPAVCSALASGPAAEFAGEVLSSNVDLKVAAARLRQAGAVARQAGAPRWPRLDGRIEGTRGDATGAGIPGVAPRVSESYQGSVAASYEVDAWQRVAAGARAAELDARQSAELLASLRITVHAQTLETWYSLVAQRRLIDLLDAQAESSARFLELTRLRYGLGQTAAQDIGRQRQNLLSIEGQLAQAREQATVLEARLAALAGRTRQDLTATLPRALPPLPAAADPGVPASLAANRPDVRAAMAALAAADQRTAAAAADRLPRLTLTGSLSSVEDSLGDLFSDSLWQLGLSAAAPVFDAGATRARVDAAEAAAEVQLYTWASTMLEALREVETALAGNRYQADLIVSLDEQLAEAVRVLELTRDFYRLGQGDYLDVLTALLSQQSLQRQQLEARRRQFVNRVTLCRALGIGPADTAGTAVATHAAAGAAGDPS